MRKMCFIVLACLFVFLCSALYAYADPRMETNKNFCHFILDPANTDNEVFFAGCNSIITTLEKVEAVENATTKTTECEESNYIASGYAKRSKQMPPEAAPLAPGTTLVLTSDDSDTPCTMVESNGRAYKSHNWTSTITVGPVKRKNGLVAVQYEIFCQDGQR